jgi:type I protein arginine methyltransferase
MYSYSVCGYGSMMQDVERMSGYARALRSKVAPGSTVLDIGTGTGVMAILACRYGATKVYAIEPSNIIMLGREAAAGSGYAGRIEFIQDLSTNISLPERVDLIVSDIHGVLPHFENMVPTIVDARERFLKPGGHLIPERETVWAAPVRNAESYRKLTAPWEGDEYICRIPTGRRVAVNQWTKEPIAPDQFLAAPQYCGSIEHRTIQDANFRAEITQTITQAGPGHGYAAWFESILADGVRLSNAPGAGKLIYGQAFFPWTEPVALDEGDTVTLKLQAMLHSGEYIWRWNTRVLDHGRPDRVKASFSQSSFLGELLPVEPYAAASYVPELNEDGQIEGLILSLMNGRDSQEKIAGDLRDKYPARFPGLQDALTRVAAASQAFSRREK